MILEGLNFKSNFRGRFEFCPNFSARHRSCTRNLASRHRTMKSCIRTCQGETPSFSTAVLLSSGTSASTPTVPPNRLQNQPLRRPSGKGVLDDVGGVICILFQPLRMAPDLGCDPQTTFPTAFGCATHTGPPYTAIRDPAPATRKTHQSTTHYREPIHPASRLRNPLRRKINVRKKGSDRTTNDVHEN